MCLWNARNQLQNTVQLQNGFVWDRIIRKTGMNNQRPWDIWGHHSTYFSEAGLVPNMEDNAENNQQVSQEQSVLETRIETSDGRFELQTVNSGRSEKSQVSATVTYPDSAICKDVQGEKDTTAEDKVENVNFLSAGCQHGSEETDPKFKTRSNTINVSDHEVIGVSEVNIILISDSEDVEDFNGEVIEVKDDQSPAEASPTVVSIDPTCDSELGVSVVENEEIFGGKSGNAHLDVVYKCDFCEYTNVDHLQVQEHLVRDRHYRATPYELHLSGEIGRQHAGISPLTVEANMFKTFLVVCPVCFKVFPDIEECSFHFSKFHCSKFHAQYCYGLSPVKKEFVISLKNDLVCTICRKSLRSAQAYISHCRSLRHVPWPQLEEGEEQISICCRHKMDVFHDFKSLIHHLLNAHTKNTNCEFNVIVFKEPVRCLTFNRAEDKGLPRAKRKLGSECVENGPSLKQIRVDSGSGSIDTVCRFPNNSQMNMQTVNVFKCDYCSVMCLLKDDMQSHMNKEKHYSASLVTKDKYGKLGYLIEPSLLKNPSALFASIVVICPFEQCECVFESPSTCSQHYQHGHDQMSEPKYAVSTVESSSWFTIRVSRDFTCGVCHTGFLKLKQLNAHLTSASHFPFSQKPGLFTCLLCRVCNYLTGSYKTLYTHIKRHVKESLTDQQNVQVLYVSKNKTLLSLPPFHPNHQGVVRSLNSEISELKSIKKTLGKKARKRVNSKIRQLKKCMF
ncbi:uncharacterized protein LOC127873146 isoform X2 [Dreissena polymorpha]|uniref:uncharacterized protein LOC127873146 isoform X2 n=1 Tax=Dreissena polymorpha TaxID=45954 RepID=UPI002264495E|nr:uncharacterized protein LOC127873146 isoform X2 [Dreissena polymorpha]